MGRVQDKVALVVGGGQTPGETIGNGRATSITLAREGAHVVVADLNLASAEDTVRLIKGAGGTAWAIHVDATNEVSVKQMIETVVSREGRLNLLHCNVGASISLGDAAADKIEESALDRSFAVNYKSAWLAAKHALPALRETRGSIVIISSMSAIHANTYVGYKTTKLALIALTEHLAAENARHGVRVNAILPGAMNTPMAIEPRVAQGVPREEVIRQRNARIPLGGVMGTAWDVANAALFLHSDEAGFITGIGLRVDGGEDVAH